MCAYGGWPPTDWDWGALIHWNIEDKISGSLRVVGLSLFTYISGFVLYFQKKKNQSFPSLLWNKVKRLIIPCILFGCAYYFLFPSMMNITWPAPVNGTHLWYLPMIFLCIIVGSAYFYISHPTFVILLFYAVIVEFNRHVDFRTTAEFTSYFPLFMSGFATNAILTDGEQIISKVRISFSSLDKWLCILLIASVPIFYKVLSHLSMPVTTIPLTIMFGFIYLTLRVLRIQTGGG